MIEAIRALNKKPMEQVDFSKSKYSKAFRLEIVVYMQSGHSSMQASLKFDCAATYCSRFVREFNAGLYD